MIMMKILTFAAVLFFAASAFAQSGTINSLSTNPRQNQELTNSTGTETGQPSDAVQGSENEPNGLMPVTSNMEGSGSNGNMNQPATGAKPTPPNGTAAKEALRPNAKPAANSSKAKR